MKGFKMLFIVLSLLTFNLQYAQDTENTEEDLSLEKGSISSQFDYLSKKSGNYNSAGTRYEVVKISSLKKIRQNILDTLNISRKKTAELKNTISGHEATISSLNSKLTETTNNLSSVSEEKDSMSFLGVLVSKASYNFILWSVIGGLLLLLLFFIYKFRNSKQSSIHIGFCFLFSNTLGIL